MRNYNGRSPAALDELPVQNGFRLRGEEMTRLETFTDAAFAFAVTLLVVGGGDAIPTNFAEMKDAMRQVPAFAASFANIMFFWHAHHVWSRRFGLETGATIFLSGLLVFVVLVYVYPLKAIYSGAIQFFSGGYFESYFTLESIDDLRTMFVIFGAGYAALAGLIVLLNRHALAHAGELGLNELERYDTVSTRQQWTIQVVVALLSIALALGMRGGWVVLAGLIYGSLGILAPLQALRRRRRRPAPMSAG